MDLTLSPDAQNEATGQSVMNIEEEQPSSFPRAPQTVSTEGADATPSPSASPSKRKRPKAREGGDSGNDDPVDEHAIAQANLAAASIVGVVGYGPGTGGGSGIRRHTPSCDFCKRRKERCVGGPPCQTCANRGIDCTFELVNKAHFERKRTKKQQSEDDLGAPIMPTLPPPKPVEKVPRTFAKREHVSEVACMFCRERRKKCTAERPTCMNCHRRGVDCVYSDQPRARKGGRKRKDGSAAASRADGGGEGTSASGARNSGPTAAALGLPGMLMPMPFLSPLPCHFCRGQELPCDRNFPGCSNCHRRAQPCTYDPFTPDISQLGIWPAAMTLPSAAIAFPPAPGQVTNPSLAAQQAAMAAAFPYFNVALLAQLAALQHGQAAASTTNPPGTLNPLATMLPVPVVPQNGGVPDGPANPVGSPSGASATTPNHHMVFPPGFDPAAALAQAHAAAQVAAVAQSEPVVERSAPLPGEVGSNDGHGERDPVGGSPDQQPEDADGEDDDDLDLDDLDDLQPGGHSV